MSFRLWKRDSTPAPRVAAEAALPAVLPPDLLAAGTRRLKTLALVAAAAVVLFGITDRTLGPIDSSSETLTLWLLASLGGVGLSLAVAWIAWREMLAPEDLLDFALVYEVVQALCLGILFHSAPIHAQALPRGWSAVAVWILSYPLIIPSTRGKTLLATTAAAVMDPLGLMINILAGNPSPQGTVLVLMFLPTLVAATVAIVLSRIVYQLNVEAGKGLEMGSYHLEKLLGRGGMGEVWRASHRLLARSAAIKLIRPDSSGNEGRDLVKRFELEAKATATLQSPHTVDIYDFGTTEDGSFYYVMELLDGFDLETLVKRFGAVPPERAVSILVQACHSLAEAHQGGLIHRDVKPANIYVCRYGLEWDFVKLLDFGLVKNTSLPVGRGRQLTVAGVVAGTPGFMPPEIGLGNPDVDWRADIYALGCVGYWLLTGKEVFDGGTPMQVVMDHVQKQPIPPSQRTENEIPDALDQIILSCLQKDPNNRPQTMQDVAQSLRRVPLETPWTEERARHWWLAHGTATREDAEDPAEPLPKSTPEAAASLAR